MTVSHLPHPKPTAQVEPYFEVLGLDDTLRFIEAFGGTEVYIAGNPQSRSSVVTLLGYDRAKGLCCTNRPEVGLPLTPDGLILR